MKYLVPSSAVPVPVNVTVPGAVASVVEGVKVIFPFSIVNLPSFGFGASSFDDDGHGAGGHGGEGDAGGDGAPKFSVNLVTGTLTGSKVGPEGPYTFTWFAASNPSRPSTTMSVKPRSPRRAGPVP